MKLVFKFDGGRIVSHEVFERTFTIGRSEDCRVCIDSEHFSREHCLIELIDGNVYVTDLNSKNGIFINHIRVPKKMKVNLDLRLPFYMGECFVSIDITKDLRDADYLSLETHDVVDKAELYRPLEMPKRIPSRPKPVLQKVEQKRFLDGKGLLIAFIVLAAVTAFHFTRSNILPRKQQTAAESK